MLAGYEPDAAVAKTLHAEADEFAGTRLASIWPNVPIGPHELCSVGNQPLDGEDHPTLRRAQIVGHPTQGLIDIAQVRSVWSNEPNRFGPAERFFLVV